ncbi:MAG: hypothetical protein GEU88_03950 [Solirubrobacterales bacterium]|nr:hypothetical protein [Solirubrobacterales bacterium]
MSTPPERAAIGDQGPPATPGEQLFEHLLEIHAMLRRELATVRDLASRAAAGAEAGAVRDEVRSLQSTSPLWRLRINCLYYCRFVHGHHTLEDHQLFPALRRSDPALGATVDRLEDDHRRVAEHTDETEAAAEALVADESLEARRRVVAALTALADDLLAHLEFEEHAIGPAMRAWRELPIG